MNLSAVDLNLLWTLHVVLETKSVARAASKLHVTSPAISNALARLREILGDPLLVRSGRGLVPTPRALALAPVLSGTFGALQEAIDIGGRFDPTSTTRELSIALADADQIASLPSIARHFAARLPRARLRVVSIDTLVSRGGLPGSDIDVAVGPGGDGEGLHFAPLYEEEGVLVVRRDHPRVRTRLTRAVFNHERHVDIHLALGRAGVGHRVTEDAFSRYGLSRDIAVTVPTFAAAAMVVASTDLVTGMPRRVAEALMPAVPIKIVTGLLPALHFPMQMMWHERTHLDPAASCFREVLGEAFRVDQDRLRSGRKYDHRASSRPRRRAGAERRDGRLST